MHKKINASPLFVIVILVFLAFLVVQGPRPASGLHESSFDSPITTPFAPDPTPAPSVPKETQLVLKFVSERKNVPVEQLVVVNQYQRDYAMLGKSFWDVTLLDTKKDGAERWHRVMVDLADGSVVDDVEAIEQAERAAHRARYGKLEPALFERLETLDPGDQVPVVIWVAGAPRRSDVELHAELAARYPAAQAGLERSGNPFDVDDLDLINEIEAEYVRMLEADTQERIQALVSYLDEQGYAVKTLSALPAVAVTLPKAAIQRLVNRTDVGAVDLDEDKAKKQLDSAVPSDRVPAVWQRGFEGNGVHIGILESEKIDFTGPAGHNYLHQGDVRPCAEGDEWHKTMVASVAASYHSTYRSVAPEAIIDDACTDTSGADTIEGLAWATNRADPINASINFNNNPGKHWTDKAFDHWARAGNDTIVVGAGDYGDYVGSPGKGWNTLTVGGTDDRGTSAWADDLIRDDYPLENPTDIEKPEVVAPATSITAVALNGGLRSESGTSLSAPQVAGLAALLIDRKSALAGFPTAIKAIIMASAVHNIVGPSGIPTGQDLKDGAGAIDAALADQVAKYRSLSATIPCTGPCWWGFIINNTGFPEDATLYRYFNASRGERIRVAIAWWSDVDCPDEDHCDHDRLDTDLHMGVQYLDGTWEWVPDAWSASNDNSYELVDFTAPHTGQYRIAVKNARSPGTYSNQLGIAWVKDATYLPDLRNKDGWVSEFYVCNEGAVRRSSGSLTPPPIYIYYSDANGNPTPKDYDACDLDPNGCCWIPVNKLNRIPSGSSGSAIVSGGEDVAVVVEQKHSTQKSAYTGIRPQTLGDPAWETADTDLYLPYVYNNYYGYTSQLRIFNPAANSATVTVRYYFASGGFHTSKTYTINANGSKTVLPSEAGVSSNFYGSAYIRSNQAVAVVADAYNTNIDISTMAGVGSTTAYLPYIMKQYYGWDSCFVVRNVSSSNNTVRVTYYWSGAQHVETSTLAGYSMWTNCQQNNPNLPSGNGLSAKIESLSNKEMIVAINQSHVGDGKHMSYNASGQPSYTAVVPYLLRNHSDGGTWSSGFQVQNAGSANTCVTIKYYDTGGTLRKTDASNCIPPGEARGFYLPNVSGLGNGVYSAMITADQPIVAVGNATCTSCGGDNVYAFN